MTSLKPPPAPAIPRDPRETRKILDVHVFAEAIGNRASAARTLRIATELGATVHDLAAARSRYLEDVRAFEDAEIADARTAR